MNESAWPPIRNIPAPFNARAFQKQLNNIAGVAPNGWAKIRLVWGQDVEKATVFFDGAWRLRYFHHEDVTLAGHQEYSGGKLGRFFPLGSSISPDILITVPVDRREDIGIPRFFLEQYLPPSIACLDWDKHRYEWVDGVLKDRQGPPPRQGWYEEGFHLIAKHEGGCCEQASKQNLKCYGAYRHPDESDIEYVKQLLWLQAQEPLYYAWDEVPPADVMSRYIATAQKKAEDARQAGRDAMREAIRGALASASSRFTEAQAGNKVRNLTKPATGV